MTALAPVLQVSDHAVVRYLERVLGVDVDRLRRDIASQCPVGLMIGDVVSLRGDHEYHIKSGVLVTVIPRRGRRK